ncbi:hypothetical protein NDN08_005341 [Rhodosorus marinus]|uniref:Uncharacterized protein n=1 Tax=Rhodosorus marinus TaxID=101924 RepID=A0AAV8V567_9RHOD|nr:hypothetical protein NDN08_005341 [Rhodosorus marinus]
MAVLSSTLQGPALDVAMWRAQLDPSRSWLILLDPYDYRQGGTADAVWTRLLPQTPKIRGTRGCDLIQFFEDEFTEITEFTQEELREDEKLVF